MIPIKIDLPDGRKWIAMGGIASGSAPIIGVPIDQIDGLTDQDIGRLVRDHIKWARYASVMDMFWSDPGLNALDWLKHGGDLETILEFKAWNTRLDRFIAQVEHELDYPVVQGDELETARAEFRRLRSRLETAMVTKAERRCIECRTTKNVHMDHIIPLARGGQNNIANLQWLCQSCNSKKGASLEGVK